MASFYCEYCGNKYVNVMSLAAGVCMRHPLGMGKGKHKLYEGSEKNKYSCKHCGNEYANLQVLTASSCMQHPKGVGRGKHEPAL